MHKSVTLLKQTLVVNCEQGEDVLIDQATILLDERITAFNEQINHREKALLMSALSLLVDQLKASESLNKNITHCHQTVNSLNNRLTSVLS